MAFISPTIHKSLVFPKADTSGKGKRKLQVQELPDCLTSPDALRKMALKDLAKIRAFASKEKQAKLRYTRNQEQIKKKQMPPEKPTKASKPRQKSKAKVSTKHSKNDDILCMGCHMLWKEDENLSSGSVWLQCKHCDKWIHEDCCPVQHTTVGGSPFLCPECKLLHVQCINGSVPCNHKTSYTYIYI